MTKNKVEIFVKNQSEATKSHPNNRSGVKTLGVRIVLDEKISEILPFLEK